MPWERHCSRWIGYCWEWNGGVFECGLEDISKAWAAATVAWVGVIFFSSTNLAQIWADRAYIFFTGQMAKTHAVHGLPYMLVDKGFHVSIFCVFAILLSQALPAFRYKAWKVVASGALLGCCSEYLQSFFPGRDPAVRDVFINLGGTIVGVLIHSWFWRRFSLKHTALRTASTPL